MSRILAELALALAFLVGAFFYGRHVGVSEMKASQLEAVERAVEKQNEDWRKLYVSGLEIQRRSQAARAAVDQGGRALEQALDRAPPPDCRLPDDALRVLRDTVDAANAAAAGQRDAAVPADPEAR